MIGAKINLDRDGKPSTQHLTVATQCSLSGKSLEFIMINFSRNFKYFKNFLENLYKRNTAFNTNQGWKNFQYGRLTLEITKKNVEKNIFSHEIFQKFSERVGSYPWSS